jgi:hypothetical protein
MLWKVFFFFFKNERHVSLLFSLARQASSLVLKGYGKSWENQLLADKHVQLLQIFSTLCGDPPFSPQGFSLCTT